MTGERWREIERVYHAACERREDERAAFLDQACSADDGIRGEVESLLEQERGRGFPDQSAMKAATPMGSQVRSSWRLAPGTRLGPYEITASIGAGGMAEVYRARDTKLHRDVAIKVLPEAFAQDRERVARFHREAQLLASLNHPRIAAIYGLEESDGICGLALELVEGDTLAERIAGGRVPVEEAVEIARRIAEALEAAHAKGVVHRDLKPANIKITRDGAVKVLDFGLAKIFESGITPSDMPTRASLTEDHRILGTVGYMSPEQARGKDVDKRTDVWAWGCVLYEMLTGNRTFDGDTTTDVIAKIVTEEPDWTRLPENTPTSICNLLRRTLQKDPNRRLHDIADARIEIEEPPNASASLIQGPRKRRDRLAWIAATAALLVATVSLAIPYFRPPLRDTSVVRFTVLPPKAVFVRTGVSEPEVSPDGRYLAFNAYDNGYKLWVRPIDAVEAQLLPGTDGANGPFWSPDSKFIGFNAGGKVKKVSLGGGSPEVLGDGGGETWNSDGVILGVADSRIYRLSSAGGVSTPVTSLNPHESRHLFPYFLPDGRHFLYMVESSQPEIRGVYAGSLDSKETKKILDAATNTKYSEGYLLWVQCELTEVNCEDGALMAQSFDTSRLEKKGDPFLVAQGAGRNGRYGSFSASNNGVLAYGGPSLHGYQLAWFDRTGRQLATVGQLDFPRQVRLSANAKRVAIDLFKPGLGSNDLWLAELSSDIFTRFTTAPSSEADPIWSPEGGEVVFASNRENAEGLYLKRVGGADETLLLQAKDAHVDDWSKDGRYIIYHIAGGQSVYALPLLGDRKPQHLLQDPFDKDEFNLSADGHWIAYNSTQSGKTEVYVAAFPSMSGQHRVSNAGGGIARWRRDGKELYYLSADGKLMVVDVKLSGATIETSVPKMLFETEIAVNLADDNYDVTADGQKFLLLQPADQNISSPPITVVVNWLAASKLKQ